MKPEICTLVDNCCAEIEGSSWMWIGIKNPLKKVFLGSESRYLFTMME